MYCWAAAEAICPIIGWAELRGNECALLLAVLYDYTLFTMTDATACHTKKLTGYNKQHTATTWATIHGITIQTSIPSWDSLPAPGRLSLWVLKGPKGTVESVHDGLRCYDAYAHHLDGKAKCWLAG